MFTDSYYLIGEDISHSFSPEIYNFLFAKYGLNNNYSGFSFKRTDFDNIICSLMKIQNLKGFNITFPFKKDIVRFTKSSEEVNIIGGANTVIKRSDDFYSYNTDGKGFFNFIKRNNILSDRFLIAGTGITARSIAYSLYEQRGIKCVFISRDISNIHYKSFFDKYADDIIDYKSVNRYSGYFFINATPVNVIDYKLKTVFEYDKIFDVNYNINNSAYFNGIILLIEQALINFKIFTGIDVYDDYYCVNKYLTEVRKNGNAN